MATQPTNVAPHAPARTRALSAVRSLLRARVRPAPRSLLLSGPPGVGKSVAVHAAAHVETLRVWRVSPSDAPTTLSVVLSRARRVARVSRAAVVVFIDEIDGVCAAPRPGTPHSAVNNATAALLSFLAPVQQRDSRHACVFVVAATNRPHAVHPRLLNATIFHKHVQLPPPAPAERLQFLSTLLPEADPLVLRYVADRAAGFVAADLASLCTAAREAPEDQLNDKLVSAFEQATPSVLRNTTSARVPETSWQDIGGMEHAKRRLQMAVEWPLRYSSTFHRLGLKAPRGVLLHGPPGCSKTSLVRAAASQSRAAFIRLSGADIYSCYLGEAERMLREAFANARAAKPSILFLDEIDAIVGKRSTDGQADGNGVQQRVLSTLLTEMDGIASADGVLVIAASNRVDLLDDALLRPGRFDDILPVQLPGELERLHILSIHTKPLTLHSDVDLAQLAHCTNGYSGADLKALCSQAGLAALREAYHKYGAFDSTHFHQLSTPNVQVKPARVSMRHFVLKTEKNSCET